MVDLPGSIENSSDESQNWQNELQDYVSIAGFRHNKNLRYSRDGINLSLACLGEHLLPTKEILKTFNDDVEMLEHLNDTYPPIEGAIFMREAAAEFVAQRNVEASADDIIVTVGSQQAISLISRTYIGPGDVIVVGAPTYPGALDIFKSRGAVVLEVPVDRDGMDMYALLSICESHDVKMVYTMTSFQNPTGAVMTLERKQMLLELAEHHNFIILEDDVCGQLVYDGSVLPLKALDTKGRVLYVFGFSKLYGHALRMSLIVAAEAIRSKLLSAKSSSDGGAPLINQMILTSFINSRQQKHYLTDLTSNLKDLRNEIYGVLKEALPSYVEVEKPRGGMLFWLTFPKSFNCNLLHYKSIEKYQIRFLPGEFCYSGKRGRNQLRICFTTVEKDVLIDSIIKLCGLMDEINEMSNWF